MALMGIALRAHPAGTLVGWQQLCDFVFQGLTRKGRSAAESGQRLVADAALLEGGSQRFAVELRMPAAAGNASDMDYLLDAVVLEVAEKNLRRSRRSDRVSEGRRGLPVSLSSAQLCEAQRPRWLPASPALPDVGSRRCLCRTRDPPSGRSPELPWGSAASRSARFPCALASPSLSPVVTYCIQRI